MLGRAVIDGLDLSVKDGIYPGAVVTGRGFFPGAAAHDDRAEGYTGNLFRLFNCAPHEAGVIESRERMGDGSGANSYFTRDQLLVKHGSGDSSYSQTPDKIAAA